MTVKKKSYILEIDKNKTNKIMRYAIIEISGRQFWIEKGKYYDFNKISLDLGKRILLNRVLLLNGGEGRIYIGKPYLGDDVIVRGRILKHFRSRKKLIYKMKPKKKTRKKQGHRQELTRVLIDTMA